MFENKISEVITKAYEGKDITRFKQTANIPEAVAKLYADMFGITTAAGIKALRVKAQNIPLKLFMDLKVFAKTLLLIMRCWIHRPMLTY